MTGKQFKLFAEGLADEATVEVELKGLVRQYQDDLKKLAYNEWPETYYEDLPVVLLRVVTVPPVVLAERAAKRLGGE